MKGKHYLKVAAIALGVVLAVRYYEANGVPGKGKVGVRIGS